MRPRPRLGVQPRTSACLSKAIHGADSGGPGLTAFPSAACFFGSRASETMLYMNTSIPQVAQR